MLDALAALRSLALGNEPLRRQILETASAAEPLPALCRLAGAHGIALTPEEIIADGEESSCNQMKSTNGGNPMPYDCFDDAYEMFLFSLR